MRLHLVLRSGGDYGAEHVERIAAQVPNMDIIVLTDLPQSVVPNKIPLLYNWPGWWSKMELCRPDIIGDVFYLDLDSAIVGDLSEMAAVRKTTLLSDFYRPEHLQSSVMLLTQQDRRRLWQAFMMQPYTIMERYGRLRAGQNGDQNFIEDTLGAYNVQRYQNVLPGAAISYKADILRGRGIDERTRVVIFHGKPRPWEAGF